MADQCLKTASLHGTLGRLVLLLIWAGCGDRTVREPQQEQIRQRIALTQVVDPGGQVQFQPPDKVLQASDPTRQDETQKTPGKGKSDAYQGHKAKSKTKEDFAKLNGSIFEDWKRPRATILLSGLLDGYIELGVQFASKI